MNLMTNKASDSSSTDSEASVDLDTPPRKPEYKRQNNRKRFTRSLNSFLEDSPVRDSRFSPEKDGIPRPNPIINSDEYQVNPRRRVL